MRSPRLARWLLTRLAPSNRKMEVVGDLEEAHLLRERRHGRMKALAWTTLEALDMATTLMRDRLPSGSGISWLDVKLGTRMLVRHRGITVLGGLSMAFAIFVGAGTFELVTKAVDPNIPLPEGQRIVDLQLWDASTSDPERRVLYDARMWREELRTMEHLTVYRTRSRNLIIGGVGTPVVVAEMWSSGFDLAGMPPLLGRVLTGEDQRPGAPAVAVIGYGVWGDRLAADPEIVGRDIRIGNTAATVVGVMPEGFAFPTAHDVWTPFPSFGAGYQPLEGPSVGVVARRVDGASLEDARAEAAVLGRRMATSFPSTHEHLQPKVQPLARAALGLPSDRMWLLLLTLGLTSNLPVLLFLVLVCGNVALLMFARASSRESELVVRSALGASRSRIVKQLFAEALVLAGAAAVVGLLTTRYGLSWALWIIRLEIFNGSALPFWLDSSVSGRTILYVGLLTVFAALVAGAWPGLRVTRDLGERLKRGTAGGGGFRFGGVWTFVIAGQILVMMLFPLVTLAVRNEGRVELDYDPPFRLEEYLVGRVLPDLGDAPPSSEPPAPGGTLAAAIGDRLSGEPAVAGVTLSERLPMTYHPWHEVEIDGPSATPPDDRGHRVGSAKVGRDFFEVLGAEIVTGRGFHSGDLDEGVRSVVVDDAFVERVLGGRNAVGSHIRYRANESFRDPTQDPGPWLEIVGVVEEIGARSFYGAGGIYHAVAPESLPVAHLIAHVPGGAQQLAGRLRTIATDVEPTRPLLNVSDLVEATREPRDFYAFWTTLLVVVSGFALLLSMAGIYAVMSFTVARQTREIGIRVALGSSRRGVVLSVFRRPLRQVALGLGSGALLLTVLLGTQIGSLERLEWLRIAGLMLGYVLLTSLVCLAACASPTARALRVEPHEALRVEG